VPAINIQVHENHQPNGENEGTFLEPHPKIRVSTGGSINFNLINGGAAFRVRFNGFHSPFVSGALDIDQSNAQQTISGTPGRYHYSVQVTKGGKAWSIDNCPELDVG
jgi:hypothetical protein